MANEKVKPTYSKAEKDNRSTRMNTNHRTHWTDRGYKSRPTDWEKKSDDLQK